MHIRQSTSQDRTAVRDLCLAAFAEEERETVADLAVELLSISSTPETYAFVAEIDQAVVGHIAFSPVDNSHDDFQGYLLAPLAVHPEFQKRGVASNLIDAGFQHLTNQSVDIVFVYGDPQFYGRFGFDPELAARFTPPHPLQYPFGWQAISLTDLDSLPPSGSLNCVEPLNRPDLW